MAKQTMILCDVCQDEENSTPGSSIGPIIIGSSRPRTVDLCDEHYDDFVLPLLSLVNRSGEPTDPEPRPIGDRQPRSTFQNPVTCLFCEQTFYTTGTYSLHFRKDHGGSMTELFGTICPFDGAQMPNTAGLGTHARAKHVPSGGVDALFRAALEQGDPLGIVAEKINRAKER